MKSWNSFGFFLFFISGISHTTQRVINIGDCTLVMNEPCKSRFVQFYLHTRKGTEYVEIKEDSDNITDSNYNPNLETKIIIHGFRSDMNIDVLAEIADEYLKSHPMNVWAVNWPDLVKECYPIAVYNIRHCGKCVAVLIEKLLRFGNPSMRKLHIVGFSLGAHVAGRASYELSIKTLNYTIPRITGLDPAMPLFLSSFSINRLDWTDADFVDVIHTNAFMQGDFNRLGHVDFYVNGGSLQPGCMREFRKLLQCDHHRAPQYFSESINSRVGFWGSYCPGLVDYYEGKCNVTPPFAIMGAHASDTGVYFVETNSESPFARGKLALRNGRSSLPLAQFELGNTMMQQYLNSQRGVLDEL